MVEFNETAPKMCLEQIVACDAWDPQTFYAAAKPAITSAVSHLHGWRQNNRVENFSRCTSESPRRQWRAVLAAESRIAQQLKLFSRLGLIRSRGQVNHVV